MMTGTIHLLMVEDNPGDVDLTREALSEARGFQLENLHVAQTMAVVVEAAVCGHQIR